MTNQAKRSNLRVMWRMLGLACPLAGWMVLAVACGVAGFCCATGIPVLAAEAALAMCGRGSLAWALPAFAGVLALMAVARGVLHFIEQRCNHYIAFKLLAHVRTWSLARCGACARQSSPAPTAAA